jgi:putative transposase
MTHQDDFKLTQNLAEKGLEASPELLRILLNQAMQAERSKHLQAEEYDRTEERKGHANGYKPKTLHTGSVISLLPCHRCGRGAFILPRWRKD